MNAVTVHVSKVVTTLWEVSSVAVRLDILLMVPDATVSRVSWNSNVHWIVDFVDINECYTSNSCEDICINTDGAYECSCSDNSEIVTEDGSCVGNYKIDN